MKVNFDYLYPQHLKGERRKKGSSMIDYRKIADAVDYYTNLGYKYIEVPWIVSRDSMKITAPDNSQYRYFSTFMGDLVASGEQSFLEIRNTLNGKYCCVTPCFRNENPVTDLTRNWFMKVELINANPKEDEDSAIMSIIDDAYSFFERYGKVKVVRTFNEFDIEMNNIEIGSYEAREIRNFHWIYGTGCAEPRLSQAINRERSEHETS